MIPVTDLPLPAQDDVPPPQAVTVRGLELNEEEQAQFDFVDSHLENAALDAAQSGAKMFTVPVRREYASDKVVAALERVWESGGYVVGTFPVEEGYRFVIGRARVHVMQPQAMPGLVDLGSASSAPEGKRLLVRMPTRGRAHQALTVLEAYRTLAGMPVSIEVIIDEDDAEMNRGEVLQRMVTLGCTVTVGKHKTKIEACNGGRVSEWDILVLASDDMVPRVDGYAKRIVEEMDKHWPHLDGALHFNDGYALDRVNTLSIMGRRYYDQFGYVYNPAYKSVFCDDEHTEVARAMGRLVYVDDVIIEHRHPASSPTVKKDALYTRNDALWDADAETCKRRRSTVRRHAQWGFDSPPLWLSIGILSFGNRAHLLGRVLNELYRQIMLRPRQVEVIIDHDPAGSLGDKRQRILDKARGKFVAFVDDDDYVAHDYIERVVGALERDPEADCTSLVGTLTTNGGRPERFEHSLKYTEWKTVNGVHERSPNHLNAVRLELAREVGFGNLTYTEDHFYSKGLVGKLKREASTGDAPLYHYWFFDKVAYQKKVE